MSFADLTCIDVSDYNLSQNPLAGAFIKITSLKIVVFFSL